ncbi:SEL1-like repeat protein [bacterium]|nr:SEL1-like repeat protein [bacterium]MBT5015325.1 SEL1-like repeat protein [bacterium]
MNKKIILYISLIMASGLQGMQLRSSKRVGSCSVKKQKKKQKVTKVEGHKLRIPGTNRFLDLDQEEGISLQTFTQMLANKKSNPYGIDVVEVLTVDPMTNTPAHHYLEASSLRAHMYGGVNRTEHPLNRLPLERRFLYPLLIKDMKTPLERLPLDEVVPEGGYEALLGVSVDLLSGKLGSKRSEDYDRVRRYCEQLVYQGSKKLSATGLVLLGEMYWTGQLVSENPEEGLLLAHKYFNQAADQQDSPSARDQARLILGEMLWTGQLVSENPEEGLLLARQHFQFVVDHGNEVVRDQALEKLAEMDKSSQ